MMATNFDIKLRHCLLLFCVLMYGPGSRITTKLLVNNFCACLYESTLPKKQMRIPGTTILPSLISVPLLTKLLFQYCVWRNQLINRLKGNAIWSEAFSTGK